MPSPSECYWGQRVLRGYRFNSQFCEDAWISGNRDTPGIDRQLVAGPAEPSLISSWLCSLSSAKDNAAFHTCCPISSLVLLHLKPVVTHRADPCFHSENPASFTGKSISILIPISASDAFLIPWLPGESTQTRVAFLQ